MYETGSRGGTEAAALAPPLPAIFDRGSGSTLISLCSCGRFTGTDLCVENAIEGDEWRDSYDMARQDMRKTDQDDASDITY